MNFIIGDPLPEPLHSYALNVEIGVPYHRQCQSEDCGFKWATVEVPLRGEWLGKLATHCPVHTTIRARTIDIWYPGQCTNEDSSDLSSGRIKALMFGAYLRRRACLIPECKLRGPKGVRWSTLEVAAGGVVSGGVAFCPKCEHKSKVVAGLKHTWEKQHAPRKMKIVKRGGYKYKGYSAKKGF